MRWRISLAALFVNVTHRMLPGMIPRSFTRYANRPDSARVLPEPAPATTRTGPSVVVTACRWASLSPSSAVKSFMVHMFVYDGQAVKVQKGRGLACGFALVLNLSVRFIGGVLGLQLLAFWNIRSL